MVSTLLKNPLVSILIPVYNANKYFVECLESVVNQTYENKEVIIVDDGSTDTSLSIANQYASKYKYISVYTQENMGASSARNKAFSHSTGEYIQYFDADDIMDKEKIVSQMSLLKEYGYNPYISSTCRWAKFDFNISNALFVDMKTYKDYDDTLKYLEECWSNAQCMIGTAWLIHRKLNYKVGGWDLSLNVYDDYLFFAKIAYYSDKIIYAKKSVVYWRQDNIDSISKIMTYKGVTSHLNVCNSLVELVSKEQSDRKINYALAMEYSIFIFRIYPLYPDLILKAEKSLKDLGYSSPLKLPFKKLRISMDIIGFYTTIRLFKFKNKLLNFINK